MGGKRKLMTSFLIWFIILVVIPVSAIFFILKTIYQKIVVDNYIEYIVQAEKNIADTLNSEIDDSSRLLASVCLVNDSEILKLAGEMKNSTDDTVRFEKRNQLKSELNYTFLHRSEIGSIVMFFRNGGTYYYRNNIVEGELTARNSYWYLKTLVDSGEVSIGGITKGSVSRSRDRYTIDLALNFQKEKEPSEVEVVRLSYFTHAMENTRGFRGSKSRGDMLIVNGAGKIMMSDRKELEGLNIREVPCLQKAADPNGEASYEDSLDGERILVTSYNGGISHLDWKILNLSDYDLIVAESNQVSVVFFSIICLVLALFTGFAVMFFKRISRQEQEKIKVEMEALQSQINPHFISNTLNSIRFMAIVAKFQSIEWMADGLIKILNTTFKRGNEILVREEIEMIKRYVYLMQIRYGGRFQARFEVEDEILECQVLKLILQPIVENAIIHGFDGREDEGEIVIQGRGQDGMLVLSVWDNGNGMSEERIFQVMDGEERDSKGQETSGKAGGIGMRNVHRRIVLQYGEKYGVMVNSEVGAYTQVSVRLPMIEAEKRDLSEKAFE